MKERNERFKNHNLTSKEESKFKNSDRCHFCNKEFIENEKKVRDHCHVTGKFRGAAHNLCNITARTNQTIKVVFHNGKNYDFKFIIRQLHKISKEISAIAFTEEKYLSFRNQINDIPIKFEFIDSFSFMN